MITVNQVNFLEQAQAARDSANWSLLVQCLQQILSEAKIAPTSKGIQKTSESELEQILDLALEVLIFGDFHQRWDVAKVFPKLGQRAIAPIVQILEMEEDEELCWYAARILGEFNHPSAISALVELLKTSEIEELSATAAMALGQIGTEAIAALTELLAAENTRLLAVRSLSVIRRQETIAPLLSVVQDSESSIRAAAIEALGSFHDERIPPVLLNALDDVSASVRREAVIGLSFRPDLQAFDLVNRLLPKLYDFNIEVCHAAANALGRLGMAKPFGQQQTDAVYALYQVLKSAHTPASLAIEIVRALSRIETKIALEYLCSALNLPLPMAVWQEIIVVLGRIEQADASQQNLKASSAQVLLSLLRNRHPSTEYADIKCAIALSLGQLGEIQAIDDLIQLLADSHTGVRLHAIAALKKLAPEAAHRQLQQMATQEALSTSLRQGVAIALAEWSLETDKSFML